MYEEFNQMIRAKYNLSDDMYSKMSHEERNKHLKAMLDNQTILIFPKEGLQQSDGMPNLCIILTDNVVLQKHHTMHNMLCKTCASRISNQR